MKIGTTLYIDSAHCLPNHPGKCKNLHGHTYKVIVTVYGEPNPKTGMLYDFGNIKEQVNYLDHRVISEVPPFNGAGQESPILATAENIAERLSSSILQGGLIDNEKIVRVRVRVYEGHNNWAESESLAIQPGPGKQPKQLRPVWLTVIRTDDKMPHTNIIKGWIEEHGYSMQMLIGKDRFGETVKLQFFETEDEMTKEVNKNV